MLRNLGMAVQLAARSLAQHQLGPVGGLCRRRQIPGAQTGSKTDHLGSQPSGDLLGGGKTRQQGLGGT